LSRPLLRYGVCALASLLFGCGETPPPALDGGAAPQAEVGVTLDAEEQAKLGIVVDGLEPATDVPGIDGTARVVDARTILAAMGRLASAEAAVAASRSALERAQELFSVDTAVSAETLEAARRQAAGDAAELSIARAEATLSFGADAPWLDPRRRGPLLGALSAGMTVVVGAVFPSGLGDATPSAIELRRLGGAVEPRTFRATQIWPGPADPSVPGTALFALLAEAPLPVAGERLVARLATGAPVRGVVVPQSAIVLVGGEAWCYVRSGDTFERASIDLERPTATGYFQASRFAVGQEIVVTGAGLLLAHETGGVLEED
jgi:hypothetical protein